MLNYSNKYRRDPNVKKYALKCAFTLAFIVMLGLLLFNNAAVIWDGITSTTSFVWSCLKTFITVTVKFMTPMFSVMGSYVFWGLWLISLWNLCVFFKIDKKCQESKNQWSSIGIAINGFFLMYTILYIGYLVQTATDKYQGGHPLIVYYLIITYVILFSDRVNDNQES